MKILITGATGFVGRRLFQEGLNQGWDMVGISRNPPEKGPWFSWEELPQALTGVEGIISLAGAPIIGKRWTKSYQSTLWESRIGTTHRLFEEVKKAKEKPSFLISASAVGIYGHRGEEILTESSSLGDDFLAKLCSAWEEEALGFSTLGIRVGIIRLGVVLHPSGGMLKRLLPVFRLGLGGRLGSGNQWMSWIALEDVISTVFWLIQKKKESTFNLTAPEPLRNKDFTKTLAKALHRPAFWIVPAFFLYLLMGKGARIALDSQRVLPHRLQEEGYSFLFPTLPQTFQAWFS